MRILVIAPSWVGDMVMAQSLFIQLGKIHPPMLQLDVLAPKWTFALLNRMPEVNNAIEMPLGHGKLEIGKRIRLGQQLQNKEYDQAIVLPNSWKSALVPFAAKIPQRTGYIGECRWGLLNDARRLNKQHLPKTVQRFVALAYPHFINQQAIKCPVPYFEITAHQQQQVIDKFQLQREKKVLALCAGAEYGSAKQWLGEHYAAVADHYLNQGWQVWLFGSEKDTAIATKINQLTQNQCIDFTGKTSIAEAVDLMSLTDAVVSNDSGLMHIAAALDKKLIALYGSSDPNFTPPLNSQAHIISLNLACSPCFKRECPLGHTRCLTEIHPEEVIAAIG